MGYFPVTLLFVYILSMGIIIPFFAGTIAKMLFIRLNRTNSNSFLLISMLIVIGAIYIWAITYYIEDSFIDFYAMYYALTGSSVYIFLAIPSVYFGFKENVLGRFLGPDK
jgi:hypothetical protein